MDKRKQPRYKDLETRCAHLFEGIADYDRELLCSLPYKRDTECEYWGECKNIILLIPQHLMEKPIGV